MKRLIIVAVAIAAVTTSCAWCRPTYVPGPGTVYTIEPWLTDPSSTVVTVPE